MNLSSHRATRSSAILNTINPQDFIEFVKIIKTVKAYLPILNCQLLRGFGIEIDLHIAGSGALRGVLREHPMFLEFRDRARVMNVGDIDIFIGVRRCRASGLTAGRLLTELTQDTMFTNFLRILGQGLSISYRGSEGVTRPGGSEQAEGLHTCYRVEPYAEGDTGIIPRFNIILREDMVSEGTESNIEAMFNSFDLNILECCWTYSDLNSHNAMTTTTWTDDFEEAMLTGTVISKRLVIDERQQKYTRYCRLLGLTADWMMN